MLFYFLILIAINCQPHEDKVHSLPGIDLKDLNYSIYSGYLKVNETGRFIHYVFVESQKSNSSQVPIFLWLNGGPGCSSMDGMFNEIGPFVFAQNNSEEFVRNDQSWNREAHLLFLESPSIVGFSINPVPFDQFDYNDKTTAEDNYAALLNFWEKFPNLVKSPFWIGGESYAGIYIPTLAAYIEENDGITIGNGVHQLSNYSDFFDSQIQYQIERFLVPKNLAQRWNKYCRQNLSDYCIQVYEDIENSNQFVNPYNIYGYCYYKYPTLDFVQKKNQENILFNRIHEKKRHKNKNVGLPCGYVHNMEKLMNKEKVKRSLHVDTQIHWDVCMFDDKFDYHYNREGSIKALRYLIEKNKFKILIYSGDADSVVPYIDSFKGLQELDLIISKSWRPYYSDKNDQLSGFIQDYEKQVSFLTVRGAGHMVPGDKREEAFQIFNKTIHEESI